MRCELRCFRFAEVPVPPCLWSPTWQLQLVDEHRSGSGSGQIYNISQTAGCDISRTLQGQPIIIEATSRFSRQIPIRKASSKTNLLVFMELVGMAIHPFHLRPPLRTSAPSRTAGGWEARELRIPIWSNASPAFMCLNFYVCL